MRSCIQPLLSVRVLPVVLVLALIGFGPGANTRADFVASNLTATQGFNTTSGYNLTGPNAVNGQGFALGVRFTTGSALAVAFDSAQLALAYRSGGNALDIAVMTDRAGVPSGVALETIHVTNISANPGLVTASSSLHPILAAGVSYWLVATYGAADTNIAWYLNSTGATGQTAYRSDSATTTGAWNYYSSLSNPAFAVSGTSIRAAAVDAPSSGLLVGIGSLGLLTGGWMQRRRPRYPIASI